MMGFLRVRHFRFFCVVWFSLGVSSLAFSQERTSSSTESLPSWLKKVSISGYIQVRHNGLFETNSDLQCRQCDKSWGGGQRGFFLRRARVKFYGWISPQVYFYIQPDFANGIGSSANYAQLRDVYFDLGLDPLNEYRFRIGQSKIPYGFENMQSSQNRIPLDRNDPINSAFKNERDIGVFFYWTPKHVQELFAEIKRAGLKHSGNYGMMGVGIFNGQTANAFEKNDEPHYVFRWTYPYRIGDQILEVGVQGYYGKYVSTNYAAGLKNTPPVRGFEDKRVAVSVVYYPQPFGFQAEYNVGRGPRFSSVDQAINVSGLTGGYFMFNYRWVGDDQVVLPFFRVQYYDGGKKHERDARSYWVREAELGLEWQPWSAFELVAMYTFSRRHLEDFDQPKNHQQGSLLRLQAQLNF